MKILFTLAGLALVFAKSERAFKPRPVPSSYYVEWPASNGDPVDFGLDDFEKFDEDTFRVFVARAELDRMKKAKKSFTVLERSKPLFEKFPNHTFPGRTWQDLGVSVTEPPPGYLTRGQINQFMDAIVSQFPGIAAMVDLSVYGPATHEGRYIHMIKISDNVQLDEDENNIILVAAHHCRELVTPEIIMHIIRQLTSGYGVDQEITNIVNNNQVYLVPIVNVDGMDYIYEVDDNWRKNRKNGHGVDINRNYDLGWDGPAGGSTNTGSNNYRGAFPNSEEESTVLINFERERNTAKILDFHSSGREVLPAYRAEPISQEVHDYNWAVGTELAGYANYVTRTPSADGEHQQQGQKEITTFAWLVETSNMFQPPHDQALQETQRVYPLAQRFLSYPVPLSGHVRSSVGIALQASVSVEGIIGAGTPHTRQSDSRYGRYHIFLGQGDYTITFSANGHASQTRHISIVAAPTVVDVTLQEE